jgi:hypothetical protein
MCLFEKVIPKRFEVRVILRQTVGQSGLVSGTHLDQFLFLCNLLLLLVLPAQSSSGLSPAGLRSPGTGWPRYSPGYWVPFPSPLTTRRATVEVFYPDSTRDRSMKSQNQKVIHITTDSQSASLSVDGKVARISCVDSINVFMSLSADIKNPVY